MPPPALLYSRQRRRPSELRHRLAAFARMSRRPTCVMGLNLINCDQVSAGPGLAFKGTCVARRARVGAPGRVTPLSRRSVCISSALAALVHLSRMDEGLAESVRRVLRGTTAERTAGLRDLVARSKVPEQAAVFYGPKFQALTQSLIVADNDPVANICAAKMVESLACTDADATRLLGGTLFESLTDGLSRAKNSATRQAVLAAMVALSRGDKELVLSRFEAADAVGHVAACLKRDEPEAVLAARLLAVQAKTNSVRAALSKNRIPATLIKLLVGQNVLLQRHCLGILCQVVQLGTEPRALSCVCVCTSSLTSAADLCGAAQTRP
eukprot:c2288_g1_i1.p1 GENE.c2288_g1_i1~~c2288_g1_i1.p1  ORF type:complete len:325 (+),score=27.18 c2288_g1_i1:473-1447(+)